MLEMIVLAVVGLLLLCIGIYTAKGNISLLHSYHIKRITEETRMPFAKRVGAGIIICGAAILAYGALMCASLYLEMPILNKIGNVEMAVGFAVGLFLIFHAMFKYNKGIF